MHSKNIIHRDLKTDNILIFGEDLKISDFGTSKRFILEKSAEERVGTACYFSPERIDEKRYSFESDIWSLGIILYELITLKDNPFLNKNQVEMFNNIRTGKYEPIPDGICPQRVKEIVYMCLQIDPKSRPKISDILEIPILNNFISKMQFNEAEYDEEMEDINDDGENDDYSENKSMQILNIWKNCPYIKREILFKDTIKKQGIKIDKIINTQKYSMNGKENIFIDKNYTYNNIYSDLPCICPMCSLLLISSKKDEKMLMLRTFRTIRILRNHLQRNKTTHFDSLIGCIINATLYKSNIWKLIRLKKNTEYYYVKSI